MLISQFISRCRIAYLVEHLTRESGKQWYESWSGPSSLPVYYVTLPTPETDRLTPARWRNVGWSSITAKIIKEFGMWWSDWFDIICLVARAPDRFRGRRFKSQSGLSIFLLSLCNFTKILISTKHMVHMGLHVHKNKPQY